MFNLEYKQRRAHQKGEEEPKIKSPGLIAPDLKCINKNWKFMVAAYQLGKILCPLLRRLTLSDTKNKVRAFLPRLNENIIHNLSPSDWGYAFVSLSVSPKKPLRFYAAWELLKIAEIFAAFSSSCRVSWLWVSWNNTSLSHPLSVGHTLWIL